MTNSSPSGFFAGASNVNASKAIFTDVGGHHNEIKIVQINQSTSALDPSAILTKLRRAKDAGYQFSIHETCLSGTRAAELQRIKDWEVDYMTKLVYWLRGVPGSGKSTIAKTFAVTSSAAGRLGASFFCSRDYQDRRNIRLIFPTLAYYLAFHSPEFREALIPILHENPDIDLETLDLQFDKLLVRPLQLTGIHTTIIIDALDECEDDQPASAILSVLDQYINSIPYVKFFVTGRPELHIRTGFRLPSLKKNTELFLLHEVDRVSVDQDVEFYLRTKLKEIVTQRSDLDLTVPWPTDKEIAAAVEKCAGLFIVASVITRFAASPYHEPQERLKIMIIGSDTIAHGGMLKVDGPYHQVLAQSDIGEPEFLVHVQLVVGSVVVVFNPLSCVTLAAILGITVHRVLATLRSLHSIFIVPDAKSDPIRMCHKSLADYLTDKTRCTDPRFYIDPSVLHLELGLRCLRLMNASLKKGICELPRFAMNADVEDLERRREKYIGSGLEYGCRSWAMHLHRASRDGKDVVYVVECLKEFFERHLLAWLEVLSIIGDLRRAVYSLNDVAAWLVDAMPSDTNLLDIIKDSERFLLLFFDAIESSATHIYESALPLSPSSSLVRKTYEDQMSTDAKINGIDDGWHGYVRTIKAGGNVTSIAFSRKEDLIAVGQRGGVEIFEAATGQRRATLPSKSDVGSLAISLDDTILVTGDFDGRVHVWDLQTGALVDALEGHTKTIHSVVFSPSGSMIATASDDKTIRIWNVTPLDCQCVLEGHLDAVKTVCWSATGNEVISGSKDKTVKVWSISSKKCLKTLTKHTSAVISVASLRDSSLIASGSWRGGGKVIIFDAQTGNVLHTIPAKMFGSVQFLDPDKVMYTCSESSTSIRTFVIRDLIKRTDVLRSEVEGIIEAISSDGTRLATASFVGDKQNVKLWRTSSTNTNQNVGDGHAKYVSCITFSNDGQLVASGSEDLTVKIWDADTRRCLSTFRPTFPGKPGKILFSPDSTRCAFWTASHMINVFNVRSGNQLSALILVEGYHFEDMCFSPDGSQLVSLESVRFGTPYRSRVLLRDVATGECPAYLEVEGWFREITFDGDGTRIIMKDNDTTSRSWRLSSAPDQSSRPLDFVPVEDTEPFRRPDIYLHPHILDFSGGWIVDGQERRVLWVPHDLRQSYHFHGNRAVLGANSGLVSVVDFSDHR